MNALLVEDEPAAGPTDRRQPSAPRAAS